MNWKLDTGNIQLTNLSHVGIVVRDAEATTKWLSTIWNIGTPEITDYEPKKEELFVGEPFKVRIVNIKFGAFPIELLQPQDNKSIWSKFIAEKGEGIHHVQYHPGWTRLAARLSARYRREEMHRLRPLLQGLRPRRDDPQRPQRRGRVCRPRR